ncbi:hypothetical protein B0J11DRAFT_536457 [Dendryphion nanum]|uniref:Uncharacterized protein n=1 Tax=Dendryphion nanum TaxID=256645 RepID=A0A9P9DEW0_9PLEO|nr:hypothetical protein B0J11DRAFT_536457 [Dendryphion nanum]
MSVAPAATSSPQEVYAALESYNWDDDVEFQSGLNAILGTNSSPEQATELTLRARCFYYSRKYNVPIDFDSYRAYHATHSPSTQSNGATISATPTSTTEAAGGILPGASTNTNEPPAPYPTSFAHIVELITNGQPIPGIKDIPNTVLTGQGTEAAKAKRRKPWEKDEVTPAADSQE